MSKTFHIVTFGCQMNKLDSELVEGALLARGLRPAASPEQADVIIYNTCSVRQHAEDRVLSNLGRWRKRAQRDPDLIVCVMGCMAQRLGQQIADRYPYVRLVCGTQAFLKVPDYLEQIALTGRPVVAVDEGPLELTGLERAPVKGHHAFVSIMRGCDNYCTYCVVPYVRGRQASRPLGSILAEVRRLAEGGVIEVTLLGQNVNSYGKDRDDGASLGQLLELVNAVDALRRIRFLTNHPMDMTEDIFHAVADMEKVCEHVHMPAQSGSDAVLGRMNRRYTREQYLALIEMGRRIVPGIEFAGDFIVGFPGETDEEFEQSLSLLRQVRYQQSFIFRYSPRPGTRAARREDDVPDDVKRERQQALLDAQEQIDTERRASLVRSTVEVMCDGQNRGKSHEGEFMGRTRQNDIVVFSGTETPPGTVCRVSIESSTALTLFGRRAT